MVSSLEKGVIEFEKVLYSVDHVRDVTRGPLACMVWSVSRTTAGSIRSPPTTRPPEPRRPPAPKHDGGVARSADPAHAKMPCHPIPVSLSRARAARKKKEEKTSVADAKNGAVCKFLPPPRSPNQSIALRSPGGYTTYYRAGRPVRRDVLSCFSMRVARACLTRK